MLHQSRVKSAKRDREANALLKLLQEDKCFYAAPYGSNDDWYWLYAAVRSGVLHTKEVLQVSHGIDSSCGVLSMRYVCL